MSSATTILYYSFQAVLYAMWMVCLHILFKPRLSLGLTIALEPAGLLLLSAVRLIFESATELRFSAASR